MRRRSVDAERRAAGGRCLDLGNHVFAGQKIVEALGTPLPIGSYSDERPSHGPAIAELTVSCDTFLLPNLHRESYLLAETKSIDVPKSANQTTKRIQYIDRISTVRRTLTIPLTSGNCCAASHVYCKYHM